jgi:hypothetical protein
MIPFDCALKHAIYIRKDPEDIDYVDVYVAGAPDVVIHASTYIINSLTAQNEEFDYDKKKEVLKNVVYH